MIKILLVEDDPDILDLTAYVLRRERFVVLEANDGAQALRRWKTDRPDLVIMDLGLPGLDHAPFQALDLLQPIDQRLLRLRGLTGAIAETLAGTLVDHHRGH